MSVATLSALMDPGRIFELTTINPLAFKPLTRLKHNRLYVNFTGKDIFPDALQIRGEWRRKEELIQAGHVKRASIGPATMRLHKPSGELAPVFFVAPPLDSPIRDHLLMVTCHPAAIPTGASKPGIIFMGAFDPHVGAPPSASVARFLTAMFPTTSTEEVRRAVGTIDLT